MTPRPQRDPAWRRRAGDADRRMIQITLRPRPGS